MATYATAAQLAAYLGLTVETLPAGYSRMIDRASDEIYSAIRRRYDSSNALHVEAVKNAACAQVEFYDSISEDVSIGGGVSSFTAGKISMSFSDRLKNSFGVLCPRAKQYLNNVGLLYSRVMISYAEDDDDV